MNYLSKCGGAKAAKKIMTESIKNGYEIYNLIVQSDHYRPGELYIQFVCIKLLRKNKIGDL